MHDDGSFQVAGTSPRTRTTRCSRMLPLTPRAEALRFFEEVRRPTKITQDNDEEGSVPFGCRVSRDGAFWTRMLGRSGFCADTLYSWY